MADPSQREDLFDQLRKLSQSGRCRRLSVDVDGCRMEFQVGDQPGQVTMDYVQTGQVRGERQVAAFLDKQMEGR